jgi:hypothetical protein
MADAEVVPSALAPLPHAVVLTIFAQLPVDLRARCACVCRGWRAALAERSLWTRLDVSRTSGITAAVTDALLRGAAARADSALEALDVSGSFAVSREALLAVATANADSLRQLRACHGVRGEVNAAVVNALSLGDAEALLRAAPRLRGLDADVVCDSVEVARRALRAEGLLAPLRLQALCVDVAGADAEADLLALAADVAAHALLQELRWLGPLQTLAVLDAVVDAALARRLTALLFVNAGLWSAVCAPALARLLGGSALTELFVREWRTDVLLDAPAAALLAGALRTNTRGSPRCASSGRELFPQRCGGNHAAGRTGGAPEPAHA